MSSGTKPLELLPHKTYVRAIRPFLPAEAFAPSPGKVFGILLFASLFVLGVLAVAAHESLAWRIAITLGLGQCLSMLAFYGHDLSHGSIVRNFWVRYPLELLTWCIRFMPPTVWRRLHNETHHVFSNTPLDCDRQLFDEELHFPVRHVSQIVTPFDNPLRWNPLVGLSFITYTAAHIMLAFIHGGHGGPSGPYTTSFKRGRLAVVLFELAICAAMQVGILALVDWDLAAYIWCGPIPIAFSSAVTMAYIFTNHFLNPITETADPVVGTTSVAVPRIVDWLHLNFSFHTEHHLFPCLNSKYYPLVGKLLAEKFPERYNRVSILTAWRLLWSVHLGAQVAPSRPIECKETPAPAPLVEHGHGPHDLAPHAALTANLRRTRP